MSKLRQILAEEGLRTAGRSLRNVPAGTIIRIKGPATIWYDAEPFTPEARRNSELRSGDELYVSGRTRDNRGTYVIETYKLRADGTPSARGGSYILSDQDLPDFEVVSEAPVGIDWAQADKLVKDFLRPRRYEGGWITGISDHALPAWYKKFRDLVRSGEIRERLTDVEGELMIDVDRGELVVDWGLRVKRRHKFQGLPGLEKALEKAFPKAREPRAFKETREYYGF